MAMIKLQDLHIAELLTDDAVGATYGTPEHVIGLISANLSPTADSQNVYADNGIAEVITSFTGFTLELGVNDIPNEIYQKILGKTKTTDGVTLDKSSDEAKYFAVGFKAGKSNGEDKYVWLYKGKFTIPEEEYQTQGEGADFTTRTVSATFVRRQFDEAIRAMVDSDDESIGATIIDNWFKQVYPATESTPAA
jgi:phi13 family phage major tail protein